MRYTSIIIVCFSIVLFIVGCGQQQEKATEETAVPHTVPETVQFENEFVKVSEFVLKSGDKIPLHEGGPRVVYALSNYTIKWTEGDQVSDKTWQKGDVHWHEAIEHAVENIGETEANYLVITRKENPLPETGNYSINQDASQSDTDHATAVFENDNVRVVEVKIAAGDSQPMHDGVNRLIYSITAYKIEYTSDQMDTKEMTMNAGDIHWHTSDQHAVKNIGETLAHYVIFEFKQ
jgi:hypothetical protein